jgi:hypothetical protein
MRKVSVTSALLAGSLAVTVFAVTVPASAATSSGMRDLQAVITNPGTISTPMSIYHALRTSATGAWNGFNNLVGPLNNVPGPQTALATAGSNGELHVLIATTRGTSGFLFHALRSASGAWNGFNPVSGPAYVPPASSYTALAAAIVNGDLHVLLVTGPTTGAPSGLLYHAVRYGATGAWAGFNLVTASTPGNVTTVAAAGVNGDLHVLITLTTGGGLYHAIRQSSNGAWIGFNNVATAASVPGPTVTAVSAAAVGADLQVVIKTNLEVLYHAIRFSSTGAWNGFNNLSGPARVPGAVTFPSFSVADVNGDLQLMVATNTGQLYHGLRSSSNGAWNGLNDMSCCATIPAGGATLVAASGV